MDSKWSQIYMTIGPKRKQWLVNAAKKLSEQTDRKKSMTNIVMDLIDAEMKKERGE